MKKIDNEPEKYDIGKGCLVSALFVGIALVVILILVML